jgi:hypothetical protein
VTEEVAFYISVYLIGALGGLTRIRYNGEWRGWANFFAVGAIGGGCGFAVVSICIALNVFPGFLPVGWLGISITLGLSGKFTIDLLEAITEGVRARILGKIDDK